MGCEGDDRGRRYEIRVVGRLGPALRLAFPGLHATVEPRHRVLLVPADGPDLSTVLGQLGVRHVEVVRIRLCGTAAPPPRTAPLREQGERHRPGRGDDYVRG
jgi:hypothetical protein